jgi:hypothetical protein
MVRACGRGKIAEKTTDKRCSQQLGANRWHHSILLVPWLLMVVLRAADRESGVQTATSGG